MSYNTKDQIQESIKARARHKKLKGELLSPLDQHLLKVSGHSYFSLGSFFNVLSSVFFLLLKLSVICLGALFVYGKYLDFEPLEIASSDPDSISIEEYSAPVSESSVLGETPELEEELTKVSSIGASIDTHGGLVQFISGVIAVYLPEAVDSGKVAGDIVQISNEEGMDPLFISAIISVESRFSSGAKSGVGATGLMQLMPLTAKALAQKITGTKSSPRLTDNKTNIHLGISYLKELEGLYQGDKKQILAAYNMGPTKLNKIRAAKGRVPGSVQRYANEILKKTTLWNKHFAGAKKYAGVGGSTS